ncbi:LD-carboxypeptidase [Sporosarcina sp. ACRSL]|uniref:S66 family peptidase n=1 Tax=Sporosarcina sp. ACRSL TaxID=2918215 RepID=UPI001EF64B71|nr:S66 peptidase family protein [Sporosarcina sp. ACRSL]MCG7345599.1 LD-carboxypeptidase [Sporosarcina sp. ACRSL]
MIRYPEPLRQGGTIGVTAPSSGVDESLHQLVHRAKHQFEKRGYPVNVGNTVWTQNKAASAAKEIRAAELMEMFKNSEINAIIPPWGGEILMEILHLIDWDEIKPKWILGYSDLSTFLFALTVKTGIATAHGPNLVELRSDEWEPVASQFMNVLQAPAGSSIEQLSSKKFQSKWQHDAPDDPYVYKLDSPTEWKVLGEDTIELEGRFLGGCIDTIRHLVGTPYGDIASFQNNFLNDEPILWYFENCEMNATDFHRTMLQFVYAGWFENAAGIIFGRSPAGQEVKGFTVLDSMERIKDLTGLPIIYDADLGHVPPQITFVNGASGKVFVENGKGHVTTSLR